MSDAANQCGPAEKSLKSFWNKISTARGRDLLQNQAGNKMLKRRAVLTVLTASFRRVLTAGLGQYHNFGCRLQSAEESARSAFARRVMDTVFTL